MVAQGWRGEGGEEDDKDGGEAAKGIGEEGVEGNDDAKGTTGGEILTVIDGAPTITAVESIEMVLALLVHLDPPSLRQY